MVSEKGGHVKVMRALATVLVFAATLQAQNPTTEQEWRSELAKARGQSSSAKSAKWGSIVLAAGGGVLIGVGATHDQVCVTGPGTGASSLAGHLLCDQYKTVANWRLLGPGIGLTATGVMLAGVFSSRQHKAAEHLRNIENIGKQRNWSVSLRPAGVNIAFSW